MEHIDFVFVIISEYAIGGEQMGRRYTTFFVAILLVSLLTISISSNFTARKEVNAEDNSMGINDTEQKETTQIDYNSGCTVNLYYYYDIIIYGGGLQAVAAAAKAAGTGPELSVALIVPYPNEELGGIATTGGQNFWDTRKFNNILYQGGSFGWWYKSFDIGYNVEEFSNYLIKTMEGYDNITIYYCHDIRQVSLTENSNVKSIEIAGIYRDKDGYIKWLDNQGEPTSTNITGNIFIDASESCKLLRLSNNELSVTGSILTVGRYDWPEEYLLSEEINSEGIGIQVSATLMFKVSGVESGSYSDMVFGESDAWGGNRTARSSEVIREFNNKFGPDGYAIKSVNATRDGEGSDEWWINAFLIYNVDARADYRDIETGNYPVSMLSDSISTDEAWIRGRQFLSDNSEEFINALRQFDGFHNAHFLYDEDGYPVVGDILYIRESVHLTKNADFLGNGTEDTNYNITASDSLFAGVDAESGMDSRNYDTRIGIGFYNTDIHPYVYDGTFSGVNMRPDITGQKINPVYIPYETLVTQAIPNLLVAGYGSSISSVAWSELRVFPNICVMGDAAGVAAAYCSINGLKPGYLETDQINAIQSILVSKGAILDK